MTALSWSNHMFKEFESTEKHIDSQEKITKIKETLI